MINYEDSIGTKFEVALPQDFIGFQLRSGILIMTRYANWHRRSLQVPLGGQNWIFCGSESRVFSRRTTQCRYIWRKISSCFVTSLLVKLYVEFYYFSLAIFHRIWNECISPNNRSFTLPLLVLLKDYKGYYEDEYYRYRCNYNDPAVSHSIVVRRIICFRWSITAIRWALIIHSRTFESIFFIVVLPIFEGASIITVILGEANLLLIASSMAAFFNRQNHFFFNFIKKILK